MPATPKSLITEPVHQSKGVDALPPEKQDALIEAFGLRVNSLGMNRAEKLGFVETRLNELTRDNAVEKLSHDHPELFDRIATVLGVEQPPADEHWTERVRRVHAVEGKIASLGL
jgi:hypothetical protein